MNQYFDWRRMGLLIRNDVISSVRRYLPAFTVITIILILNAMISAGLGDMRENLYHSAFIAMICIWGTIHASLMFFQLTDKKFNEAFLLLPASALEKTLSRYLQGSVFFVFYVLVYTTVIALLIEGINMLLFNRTNGLFNPFNYDIWRVIGVFMLIQPVFFLGGAWFRSHRWFKTVISVFVISAALGMLACLAFFIFFPEVVSGMIQGTDFVVNDDMNWYINENLFEYILIGLKVLCFGIAPPFCIYLTWLRVQETQASHGI